jgi:hypothetical protein
MTQSAPNDATPFDDAAATDPSLALGDVWNLLDVLPAASASPDMLATTIEMAAVPAGAMTSRTGRGNAAARGGRPAQAAAWPPVRQWLPGAAIVLASLLAGFVAGRASVPTPESEILANLPVVQHLDLLREAGSVGFLEAVAKGGYPPPRRPPPAQSKADFREDAAEFDTAIASLRAAGDVDANRATLAARREQVLRMPDAERRQLERSADVFQRLTGADRSELEALGRALADPDRQQLLKAARLWHMWVQFRDPADRRDVIELSSEDRREWLDRWTRMDSRPEPRQDGRDGMRPFDDRDWENRRRPPSDFRRDDFPRPPGPPGPPRPRGSGPGMGPGPGPERGPGMGPPFNGREPPPPAEKPAQPR